VDKALENRVSSKVPTPVLVSIILLAMACQTHASGLNYSDDSIILSSNSLLNQSFLYDGMNVSYRGEVVGPVMVRGDYAWINVYDGTYAIGIWCPADKTPKIRFYGDYNNKGDVIQVSGVFHRACTTHGGDLDIHCNLLKVVKEGNEVPHPIMYVELFIGLLSGLIASILVFVEFGLKINVIEIIKKWRRERF